jgi:methyl-accepting chemotaxis protein
MTKLPTAPRPLLAPPRIEHQVTDQAGTLARFDIREHARVSWFQVSSGDAGAAITLLLICLSAIGFSFWAMQHEQTLVQQQVADKLNSIQGVFVTTATLMQDRTRVSMASLKEQISVRGGAEKGAAVTVGAKTVSDILIGGKAQAGNFDIVDYVTRLNKGTATIFSKDGEHFVRISTNVLKDDGSRAVGTELNNTTPAYAALSKRTEFYGVVDILGNPYFTGYEPLFSKNVEFIGIAYVGYKAELPVLSQALDQSHLLKSGFVAVVDSSKVRYVPSWMAAEQVQKIIDNNDGSWVINRSPLPERGLMKKIADGDLAVAIAVAGERPDSFMASLKVMQLKLKNLVSAIRGGAAEVSEQSHKFEAAYATTFQHARKDASSEALLQQAKGISHTLLLLEKSIGRFKL